MEKRLESVTDWILERQRARWVRHYLGEAGAHGHGPVAAVVHEARTPDERRTNPDGAIVSVYRSGRGENRIAARGNAPDLGLGRDMADAVLGYLVTEPRR